MYDRTLKEIWFPFTLRQSHSRTEQDKRMLYVPVEYEFTIFIEISLQMKYLLLVFVFFLTFSYLGSYL